VLLASVKDKGAFMYNSIDLIRAAALCCALALVSGCSTTGQIAAKDVPVAAIEDAAAADYIIGPGDQLQVYVWRNADISATVPVRPDGKISTPLVEDMVAVGKTPTQLARDIEGVLTQYIRSPQVNIIVERFVGTFGEQVRVVGQAAQAQSLPYRQNLTLMDVMIEVGGLTPFAAGNRAKIVRRGTDGKPIEIRARLSDLLNRGDLEQNVLMRPGDVVIIPEALF
jgi:polysaccharide biosynthesis/export protein